MAHEGRAAMGDHPLGPPPQSAAPAALHASTLAPRVWLYPRMYAWFILLAALDILLTYMILSPLFGDRGREVNAVAEWVIEQYGLFGMVVYKYALVAVVVTICQYVGRRQPAKGRRLAEWSVAITAIPVVVSMVLMLVDVYALVQPVDEVIQPLEILP
jgi:hypothetical protein